MNDSKLNRRALGLAAIGTSAALYAGTRGCSVEPSASKPPAGNPRWSVEAATKLRNRQELAYADLGKRLGLGDDPMTVYRALGSGRMPSEWISPVKFRSMLGASPLRGAPPSDAERAIADYAARYGSVTPPTPYEDPNLYAILLEMSDDIEAALKAKNLLTPTRLVLGTLPTNTLAASSIALPATHEHIVLFESGLFDFAFRMSKIAALVFPPIDAGTGWFSKDVDLDRGVEEHPEVLDELQATLYAYLVQGDPRRAPSPTIADRHVMTAATLLRSLELFVLGHEYGHIVASHSDDVGPNPSADATIRYDWDDEYGADSVGVSLMTAVMDDFPLAFWGAVHWFSCQEVFDRCRAILANGAYDPKVVSPTHPPNLARSRQLRVVARELRAGPETERAIRLADQVDSFWSRLWQVSEPYWVEMYQQGKRPAAIWQ